MKTSMLKGTVGLCLLGLAGAAFAQFWAPRDLGSAEVTRYWASQYKEYRGIVGDIGLARD